MVTEEGLEKLLATVKYQAEHATDANRLNGTAGLMRFSLQVSIFQCVCFS